MHFLRQFSTLQKFVTFYFQKEGQGRRLILSQWYLSMANIKIYQSRFYIFQFPQDTTCAQGTNTHTERRTYTQTEKRTRPRR